MASQSEIGAKLKVLRTTAGFSQKEIADLAGSNQATIARIENDTNDPSCRLLRWYSDYFDVSLDWIYGRCEHPQGKLYNYEPEVLKSKMQDKEEWAKFVKACFEPNSALNAKLQEAILRLSTDGAANE